MLFRSSLEYLQTLHDIQERWFNMMHFLGRGQRVDAVEHPDVKRLAESVKAKVYTKY